MAFRLKIIFGMFILIKFIFATVSDGPYIGFEAGVTNQIVNYDGSLINTATGLYSSGISLVTRMNLGYTINKYNSLELGSSYGFIANQSYPGANNISTNVLNLDASYLLSLPLAIDKLSVFGRFGVGYDWLNNSNGICACNATNNIVGNNFTDILGSGIKYKLSPHVAWRLEWISNGLLWPVGLTTNSGQNIGQWGSQSFLTGFNYYF